MDITEVQQTRKPSLYFALTILAIFILLDLPQTLIYRMTLAFKLRPR